MAHFMRKLRNTGKDISRGIAAAGNVVPNALDLHQLDGVVNEIVAEFDQEIDALHTPLTAAKLNEYFTHLCSSAYASYDEEVGVSDQHKSNVSVRRRILGRKMNAKLPKLQARNNRLVSGLASQIESTLSAACDRFDTAVLVLREQLPLPTEYLLERLNQIQSEVLDWVEQSFSGGVAALKEFSSPATLTPIETPEVIVSGDEDEGSKAGDEIDVETLSLADMPMYAFTFDHLLVRMNEVKRECVDQNAGLVDEAVAVLRARVRDSTTARASALIQAFGNDCQTDVEAMDVSFLSERDAADLRTQLQQQITTYVQNLQETSWN